jgi:hypothetical protein
LPITGVGDLLHLPRDLQPEGLEYGSALHGY